MDLSNLSTDEIKKLALAKKVGLADNIEISNNPFFLRRQRVFTKLSQMKEDLDFKVRGSILSFGIINFPM